MMDDGDDDDEKKRTLIFELEVAHQTTLHVQTPDFVGYLFCVEGPKTTEHVIDYSVRTS